MSSDATNSPSRPGEQRLHPWSWLFVLAQNLKQFLVPLLALLLFGGGRNEGFQLAAAGVAMVVLVAISLLEYLTYRYRVGEDLLTVRSGWLERNLREIPFARIHNIVVHQSLLHRLFGVAELRLESAGSAKPEAQMRVLRLDDALALEARVRQRGQAMPATGERDRAGATPVPARQLLLALPPAEIVRLGLISNRGMIVFAAALGAAWQVLPDRWVANAFERSGRQLYGYAEHLQPDRLHSALGAAAIVLLALALLRLLSILLAFVQYHGFRLDESQKRLTVERGLFTRVRTSVAQRRIQAWTLHEGLLHRLFRRRSLHVDTAAAQADETQARALRDLAPVIVPEHGDALVRHLLPQRTWPPAQWQPVQGSGWRLFWPGALVSLALAAGLAWRFQAGWTALPLLWWPWGALSAWQQVRRLGYSVEDGLVAVRGGWFKRWWRFADLDKVQALRLSRSPLDLRCGTATLWLDTAGAGGFEPPLCIPYLPHATAQELLATLGKRLSRQRLCW